MLAMGKLCPKNPRRGTENLRVGRFGRSLRPARRFPRGAETETAWIVTFRGRTPAGGKPNGEYQLKWVAWYNAERPHSAIKYTIPNEAEDDFYETLTARDNAA